MLEAINLYYSSAKRMLFTQSIYALITQLLNVAMVVTTALMIWQSLILVSGSESPVVVVLSGSMEPTFYRGDILLLHNHRPAQIGDIVVFKISDKDVPIVHRVVEVHIPKDGGVKGMRILTKGDNNNQDDRRGRIYKRGQMWITPDDMMGIVHSWVPIVGHLTVQLNETPYLKYGMLGSMGLWVLFTRED